MLSPLTASIFRAIVDLFKVVAVVLVLSVPSAFGCTYLEHIDLSIESPVLHGHGDVGIYCQDELGQSRWSYRILFHSLTKLAAFQLLILIPRYSGVNVSLGRMQAME